jgi:hypothetical protein
MILPPTIRPQLLVESRTRLDSARSQREWPRTAFPLVPGPFCVPVAGRGFEPL